MESKVRLFGHPIHPMLVVFPLGLLATAVCFDIVFLSTKTSVFAVVAYWMIIAGIVGGLVAAPFGFLDWLITIPAHTRAKRVGALHGAGNLVVVLLFIGSAILRTLAAPQPPPGWAYVLSFIGAGLALVTGWLGGELVDRLGIGVYTETHVDAPSSLSARKTAISSH
ncbi:MAG TPA: DUF2231 domain-containing protein [Gammaproteobacteria bacterium]|nr:DUF2231 domain-containing protein [Gammaproteobacteria bacterium]